VYFISLGDVKGRKGVVDVGPGPPVSMNEMKNLDELFNNNISILKENWSVNSNVIHI
jgi:hypothetical protein